VLQASAIAALKDAGLTGLEADHQDHDAEARAALRGIAADLGLVVTGSSDYHGTGKVDHDLGCNLTDPEQLERLKVARA
jgi:sugar phosphate isomerase/epimerase